jgi:hypothetical protein
MAATCDQLVADPTCHVTVDTKKDFTTVESRAQCLEQNFKSGYRELSDDHFLSNLSKEDNFKWGG